MRTKSEKKNKWNKMLGGIERKKPRKKKLTI
jgi:hypothetical protein